MSKSKYDNKRIKPKNDPYKRKQWTRTRGGDYIDDKGYLVPEEDIYDEEEEEQT